MNAREPLDIDLKHLNMFQKQIPQKEIATARAMYYCAQHEITPPDWLVMKAALALIELLKREKPGKRGRAAGQLARFRYELMHIERWNAVMEVRRIRSSARHDDSVLRAHPDLDPGGKGRKRERARKAWLKLDNFELAAELLEGESSYASPSAIRASYRKVEKAISDGTNMLGVWLDDDFLSKLGVKKHSKNVVQKPRLF